MTEWEAAWLAGLFEGEASFVAGLDRNGYCRVRFQLSMCDYDVVKRAADLVGAPSIGTIDPSDYESKLGTKIQYYFHIAKQQDVLDLIETIRPYLGVRRREQCTEMEHMIHKYGKAWKGER